MCGNGFTGVYSILSCRIKVLVGSKSIGFRLKEEYTVYLTEIESSKVEETIGKCYPLWYPIHFQTLKRGSGWLFWGDLIVGLGIGLVLGLGCLMT